MSSKPSDLTRRSFVAAAAAGLASPAFAQATGPDTVEFRDELSDSVRRDASSFRARDWRPYFDDLQGGAILVDISSRALHYWGQDGSTYKLYPTSVPMSEELTRRGRTRVTYKDPAPDWRPTPSMKQRNPEWPDYVPPGPDNPLGVRAMHLSWTYYRIHGTHDTRKIGRRSSNGCIGLYNEHILELYELADVGAQVLVI